MQAIGGHLQQWQVEVLFCVTGQPAILFSGGEVLERAIDFLYAVKSTQLNSTHRKPSQPKIISICSLILEI
jgi:hypothetical protein